MKMPEGWKLVPVEPTKEMLQALDLNLTPLGNFKRMLGAAPTPPAKLSTVVGLDFDQPLETHAGEPVKWITSDVIEYRGARVCVDVNTGIVYSSPYVGLQIRNVVPIAPPEQEAEPVAYIDKRGNFWSIDRVKAELEDGNLLDLRPGYTHTPSDKLRHAAEELIKAHEDGDETYLYNAVQDLRSVLKGKS